MTKRNNRTRRSAAGMATLAALALAGCAGTHVGDAWQCPLAQGSVCANVAAADPAVPATADAEHLAVRGPLYRTNDAAGTAAMHGTVEPRVEPSSACDTDCNPFDWLASLFTAGRGDTGGKGEAAVSERPGGSVSETVSSAQAEIMQAEPGNGVAPSHPATTDPSGDALREPETIGRVWIAPFVDADGVYREASWVRIVIAPAAWRLP